MWPYAAVHEVRIHGWCLMHNHGHWISGVHALGADPDGLLCLETWREVFGNPSTIVEDWRAFVEGPPEEARLNVARVRRMATGSAHNRPLGWVGATGVLRAGSPPG